MRDFQVRVYVRLKPSVHDPQGETIRGALETMGYAGVTEVRQGKYFEMSLRAGTREDAEATAREIANRVLSNPVIETFQVDIVD
ncbi:MAG TPA: phosphoribosylformylglycinamidine synthase subunit PurS [Vicinamibacteria bacterium]